MIKVPSCVFIVKWIAFVDQNHVLQTLIKRIEVYPCSFQTSNGAFPT